MTRDLNGKRILVTRDIKQAQTFIKDIEKSGGEAIAFPTVRIRPASDWTAFDTSLKQLRPGDWMIFSSTNAVRFSLERINALSFSIEQIYVASVGPATTRALQRAGLEVELTAEPHTAKGLIEALKKRTIQGLRVALPSSNLARDELAEGLEALGAQPLRSIAYITEANTVLDGVAMADKLTRGEIDCLTFLSPSAFRFFLEILPDPAVRTIQAAQSVIAAIGPTTASAIEEAGLTVSIRPEDSTAEQLLEAIVNYFNRHPNRSKH